MDISRVTYHEGKNQGHAIVVHDIAEEIFKISFISYIVLYLVDSIWGGFFTGYIQYHVLLTITVVAGLITIIFSQVNHNKQELKKSQAVSYTGGVVVSVILFITLFFLLKTPPLLSLVISLLAAVVSILLYVVFNTTSIDDINDNK